MNKIQRGSLAILGGIDVVFTLVTPILLCTLWVDLMNMQGLMAGLFYGIGFLSSLFRGIKIGVLK